MQEGDGFSAMVEFTAPVFWGFLFLVGVGLMWLRQTDPQADRPFKVPLYPLLPLVFCAACAWLTYSSISYAISQNAIHVSGWLIATGVFAWLLGRAEVNAAPWTNVATPPPHGRPCGVGAQARSVLTALAHGLGASSYASAHACATLRQRRRAVG